MLLLILCTSDMPIPSGGSLGFKETIALFPKPSDNSSQPLGTQPVVLQPEKSLCSVRLRVLLCISDSTVCVWPVIGCKWRISY